MKSEEIETGRIISLEGDMATVAISQPDICENCGAKSLCNMPGKEQRVLKIRNTIHAQSGQQVRIIRKGNMLLKISFLQFGLPLIGLLAGIFIAHVRNFNISGLTHELAITLVGFAGLFVGGFISNRWLGKMAKVAKENVFLQPKGRPDQTGSVV